MIYNKFKDISVSRLGMGCMRFPVKSNISGNPIDRDRAREIIDYAIANGINYFDTAYVYHNGESEVFLGDELVSRYPRGSFYLATKYNCGASADFKGMFEEQLRRLKTDYIDFYLLHAVTDSRYEFYSSCGCIEYFLEQQKNGRIKHFGFSSHASPETLEKLINHHKWDFVQLQMNYFDWLYGTASSEYSIAEKYALPIVVMETVRGGRLAKLSEDAVSILNAAHSDWSVPSWAFRFIKSLPQVKLALSGMTTLEQITENVSVYKDTQALDENDTDILFKACAAFKKQVQVPCTSCRYCCDTCPAEINIPEFLNVYNRYKVDGWSALRRFSGINSIGKPRDCIECGACKACCPQNIDIPSIINEIKKVDTNS